ncbi:MAG: glycosyltransferase family 39 protein [Ramlibacter sp.]
MRPHAFKDVALLACVLLWLGCTGWLRPLTLPDEGRYASVAWAMLSSGDWLTPALNGLPFFHKPPLFYWITAASLGLFGMNEWAARLASLLGAVAACASIWLLVRRWATPAAARWTVLALVAQPLFFMGAQFANLDMLLAGCVTATICLLAHVALTLREGRSARGALALAWGFAALGVLAKGLIGFVLPTLVVGIWLLAGGQWRIVFRLLSVSGVVLFAALTVPWFTAMQLRFPDFLHYFIVVQHFQRFAQTGFNNVQPFWFFPAALGLLALPWSVWPVARARDSWLMRSWWLAPGPRGALRQLAVAWLLAIVVFFSLPQSKLVGYVLPAAPPLAFLVADMIESVLAQGRWRRLALGSVAIGALLCIVAAVVSARVDNRSLKGLGQALGALRQPHEPVVFMKNFYYDVAFYARLDEPSLVVDDWADPALTHRDNWRKELVDAQQFASKGAANVLLQRSQLPARLCQGRAGQVWLVGPIGLLKDDPLLAGATEVTRAGNTVLWRLPAAPACAGQPGPAR